MDLIKKIGTSISTFFGDVWDKIKSLSGELRDFFIKAWEKIKYGLQSLYELLLRFGRFLKELVLKGWESFTELLGFVGEADGGWIWEMPSSGQTTPLAEPTSS